MNLVTDLSSLSPDGMGPDAPCVPATPAEPPRVVLQMPVDVRSISLVVLATIASVVMLRWASAVFIPVMVGLLGSYALSPVVDWLQVRRIPRAFSAALLIMGILGSIGVIGYSLSDDASKLVESLPAAAQKLRDSVHALPGAPDTTLVTVQKAAAQLEQAAEESNRVAPVGRGVQRVQIEKPKFDIKDHLWTGGMGLMTMLGQLGMMALIAFFLMASGDSFRRKMVKLAGPTLAAKKITLQALNQIHDQIQRYMMVQLFTSVLVGLATWLCLSGDRSGERGGLGHCGGRVGPGALYRERDGGVGLGADGLPAVRHGGDGRAGQRVVPVHPLHRGLPADSLADQPRQQDEPGGRLRGGSGLGLALGRVGPAARGADPGGRQGHLRPG